MIFWVRPKWILELRTEVDDQFKFDWQSTTQWNFGVKYLNTEKLCTRSKVVMLTWHSPSAYSLDFLNMPSLHCTNVSHYILLFQFYYVLKVYEVFISYRYLGLKLCKFHAAIILSNNLQTIFRKWQHWNSLCLSLLHLIFKQCFMLSFRNYSGYLNFGFRSSFPKVMNLDCLDNWIFFVRSELEDISHKSVK